VARDDARAAARAAQQAGNWEDAAAQWAALRVSRPEDSAGYLGGAAALRALGRLEQADAVLAEAAARFPALAAVRIGQARLAQQQGRWEQAVQHWQAARLAAPDDPACYAGLAGALRMGRRFGEAEDILGEAAQRFPDHQEIELGRATTAASAQNWQLAERRWVAFCAAFADLPAGPIGLGRLQLGRGRPAEALAVATAAEARFPQVRELTVIKARALMALQRWQEAGDACRAILATAPDDAEAIAGVAEALTASGDLEGAGRWLLSAKPVAGETAAFAWAEINLAARGAGLPETLRAWRLAAARFPDDRRIARALAGVLIQAAEAEAEGGDSAIDQGASGQGAPDQDTPDRTEAADEAHVLMGPAARPDPAALQSPEKQRARTLLSRFESLGDACEFGIVQREFGLEPLGLLRWSSIPLAELTDALDSSFEGVGEPAQTKLEVVRGEYVTQDRRFFMRMHTFISAADASPDLVAPKLGKRLKFLRGKLLEDLAEGHKIFVYRSSVRHEDAAFAALHAALRRYGPNRLLVVVLADADTPAECVRWIAPGCLIGGIARLHVNRPWLPGWQVLCERAAELLG
jgi:tetratricopeptide (TPR) repeat protein